LPRTVKRQCRVGSVVASHQLLPGDLVFFQIHRDGADHVGIYVGDGEFVHAPRKGAAVRQESLANPWWGRRLLTGRRVY
jgi:cell wall-associated NlpC family hydrolase